MNLRQRKYQICMGQLVRMMLASCMVQYNKAPAKVHFMNAGGTTRRVNIDWEGLMQRQSVRSLVEEDVVDAQLEQIAEDLITAPAQTFTVARKKDGEIVGTFATIDAAQAVIDKAKAAKKASLVLV